MTEQEEPVKSILAHLSASEVADVVVGLTFAIEHDDDKDAVERYRDLIDCLVTNLVEWIQ